MYHIIAFTQWPLKSGAMLMMTVIQGIEEEIKQNHIAWGLNGKELCHVPVSFLIDQVTKLRC